MSRTTSVRAGAAASAVLIAVLMVMGVSRALFTNPTSADANSFSTGSVELVNEDALIDGGPSALPTPFDETGSGFFSISGIAPGESTAVCFEVIYRGTLAADILLESVTITGVNENGIGAALTLVVNYHTDDLCTAGAVSVASGTLAAPGLTSAPWQPTGPESGYYLVTVALPSGASNDLQDSTVDGVEFQWLATNS